MPDPFGEGSRAAIERSIEGARGGIREAPRKHRGIRAEYEGSEGSTKRTRRSI